MSERRPRLFFVNRVYWPSTEATAQLLTDLATGLAARSWDIHIIAAGAPGDVPGGVQVHRTGPGEKNAGLVSRTLNYLRFLTGARRQLRALVGLGDVVVFMTDPPLLGPLTASVAQQQGARVIHWAQDIYPEILSAHLGPWTGPLLAPLRALRNRALRTADAGVTLGTDMAAILNANGCAAARLHVVPNWAPRELATEPAADAVQAQRATWGLAGKFIVAYSGNLGRVHEFATIIAAAEQLRDEPSIAFVFIGKGARFAEVRRAATARRLTNIHFFPAAPRAQLAASLAAADAQLVTVNPAFASLVYPSKLAGVLAAARPVLFVGPTTGEIAQLLQRHGCGRAFAPGKAAALADTLRAWQADPGEPSRLGRQARAAYIQRFTPEASLAAWESVFANMGQNREVPLR